MIMQAFIYIKLLLILVFFNSMCSYAQEYPFVDWTYQTFGTINNLGHEPTAMTIDDDNVYVIGGFVQEIDFDPDPDVQYVLYSEEAIGFVAKYTMNGTLEWAFALDVAPRAIDVDESGNIYISGYFNDIMDFDPGSGTAILTPVSSDFFIAKYNADGEYQWVIKGEPFGNSFTDVQDLSVSTINNRLTISAKYWGEMDIDPDPTTEFILPSISSVDTYAFYATYSLEGEFLWAHFFNVQNVAGPNRTYKADYDKQGNLFVSGHFSDTLQLDPLGLADSIISWSSEYWEQDAFVAKYNQLGEFEWAATVQSDDDIFLTNIAASDETVSITGRLRNETRFYAANYTTSIDIHGLNNTHTAFLASYDNQVGALNFAFILGVSDYFSSVGADVVIDGEENVYFSGRFGGNEPVDFDPSENEFLLTNEFNTLSDPFVAKYSPSGGLKWAFSMPKAQSAANRSLAVSDLGEVVVTGTFQGPLDVSGYGESNTLVPASEFVSTLNPLMYIVKYNQLDTTVYSEDESIILFPNPSSESHTLQLIGYENQKAVIDMYDIQGRMVKRVFEGKLNANEELMVDLSQLGAGMYLYTISTPSEQTSIKFIKE
jgi:hypothetical protein